MRKRAIASLMALAFILIPMHFVHGCSWAESYFHQVTNLKGRVVGRNLHMYGLGYVRWLRQRPVNSAQLKLYKYVYPFKNKKELVEVAHATSDSSGNFDFGSSVPAGHYYLEISTASEDLYDWFDVEVTKEIRATKSVLIDISPNYPDCKGGHEFNVFN